MNSGDTETLRALWAEDIIWQSKGPSPWQGTFKGADAIFEFLAQLGEVGGTGYHIDVDDVMIGEERAAITLNIKASRDGRALDTGYVLLARLIGRRVHEIITIALDPEQVEEFWRD
jgi:ketosteroid isomerase-like protein